MVLQDIELHLFHEVEGVESVLGCHSGVVDSDEDEGDERDDRHDPERDLGSTVKGINSATKADSHSEAGAAAAEDGDTNPILHTEPLGQGQVGRVDVRQAEEHGWRGYCRNDQVNPEGPPPADAALGKCTANDGPENGAGSPYCGDA